ncbi:MAG: alpha/beta hydrolase, partial [Cyanobacteria bacterium J06629_18]
TIDWIRANATQLKVPTLILHGGADKVTLPRSSKDFFESLSLVDKQRKEYPDSYHELHNDINYLQVLGDIEDWIQRH